MTITSSKDNLVDVIVVDDDDDDDEDENNGIAANLL